MPNLVKYGMMSTEKNGLGGYLVKAQCCICGAKYGSVKEAKKCEKECFNKIIQKDLFKELFECLRKY